MKREINSDTELANASRFRSSNGSIYSRSPLAFRPKITTTGARQIMNDLYAELCKHDPETAEAICKRRNA